MGRPVSLVWVFFDKINKDEAKCKYCKKVLKTTWGSTKSLTTHIGIHPSVHKEYLEKKKDQEITQLEAVSEKRKNTTSQELSLIHI